MQHLAVAMAISATCAHQGVLGNYELHVLCVDAGAGALLVFGTAGPAPPASYTHSDGGVYRGQWVGAAKQGLGQYRYPSGAKYAGEWSSNEKTGLGVYTFPRVGFLSA